MKSARQSMRELLPVLLVLGLLGLACVAEHNESPAEDAGGNLQDSTADEDADNTGDENDESLDSRMIVYWPFDEGEGSTTVDKIEDRVATIENATWETSNVAPGGDSEAALRFNGEDAYVDTGISSIDLNIEDHATYMAWIYIEDLDASDRADIISDWDGSGTAIGDGVTLRVWPDGSVEFYAYPSNHRATSDPGLVVENQWYLLAGVIDGERVSVYLDGVEVAEVEFDGYLGDSGHTLKVGTRGELSERSFTSGIIDQVRVYNEALPASDLTP